MQDNISIVDFAKSTEPNSIPTFILRRIKDIISFPFTTFMNISFQTVVFPENLKVAQIVPVIKSGITADPYLYSQTLAKLLKF